MISTPPTTTPHWQVPELSPRALLGGVAAGLADEVGVEPLVVRVAFVVLTGAGGLGIAVYGLLWLGLLLYWSRTRPTTPRRVAKGRTSNERLLGVVLVVGGLFLLGSNIAVGSTVLVWGLGAVGAGVLVFWGRSRDREVATLDRVIGALLVVAGLGLAASPGVDGQAVVLFAGAVLIVAGLVALASAPWWVAQLSELDVERQARVRADERTAVGAHLHDSVLQTLALIQKTDDPDRMVALARRQERELRSWIDRDRAGSSSDSVRARLDRIADDVEEHHGVRVDVVVVGGDRETDESLDQLLAAAGEAAVNAAKHAEVASVDVFVDLSRPDRVELFVRDTGIGFDPDQVDPSRLGVRSSIMGRMERLGGTAEIHSEPGHGTEVELVLPVESTSVADAGSPAPRSSPQLSSSPENASPENASMEHR